MIDSKPLDIASKTFNFFRTKNLIFGFLCLIIIIIFLINVFSYIKILSKSSENPDVPKSRATASLIACIVVLLLTIIFAGYYFYRWFNPVNSNISTFGFLPSGKDFPKVPIKTELSPCYDAEATLAEKSLKLNIEPINLRPTLCAKPGPGGQCFDIKIKDPRGVDTEQIKKAYNTYSKKQLSRSDKYM
jgi:hypothetical protein